MKTRTVQITEQAGYGWEVKTERYGGGTVTRIYGTANEALKSIQAEDRAAGGDRLTVIEWLPRTGVGRAVAKVLAGVKG
jgi:hypothetical protein